MTTSIPPWLLVVLILIVGVAASIPGTLALARRRNGNGQQDALQMMRQLSDCYQERDGQKQEIANLRQRVATLEATTATQEAEIASLRRTIVSMASDHSNAATLADGKRRRSQAAQAGAGEAQRVETMRQELAQAQTNLARLELERTTYGPDVHRDNQIAATLARIAELEQVLDG